MNWSIFWGIFLVLLGLSFILKVAFNVDFPMIRIVVALFFIYLGIKIFVGKDFKIFEHNHTENALFFGQRTILNISDGMEYNVIFGHGILDLRNYNFTDSQTIHVKLNTIFGSSDIIYTDSIPIKVKSTSAFAGTKLPDGNTTSFGTFEYTPNGKPAIYIETSTVFGQTIFKKR